MTIHSYHPDSHTHGLEPGCPRCEEHARHPHLSLDAVNRARLLNEVTYTVLDEVARVELLKHQEDR